MKLKSTLTWLICLSGFIIYGQTPSIITQVSPSSFCPEDIIIVSFLTSDTFVSDNIFTVQLSDSAGSFSNPIVLDTLSSQSGDTLFISSIPVAYGVHYKIRVVGSNPAVTGIANQNDLTFKQLLPPPATQITVLGNTSFCDGDTVKLKIDSISSLSTKWWLNGHVINTPTRFYTLAKDSGVYLVEFTDTVSQGCSSGDDSVLIAVHTKPAKPSISANGATNICGTGSVTLSTPQNSLYTYKWTTYGGIITGANARNYVADTTGQYKVIVTNTFNCSATSDSLRVNINANPVVTLSLQLDSFCLNSPPIHLEGGLPLGGYYSGNYVSTTTFYQSSSGLGTFTIYYTYTDSIGCTDIDSSQLQIFDCTTSGIEDISYENLFVMYPNPSLDVVTFKADNSAICKIRILNLLGEEVVQNTFSQQVTLSTGNLAQGTYIVEFTDLLSQLKSIKHLVVQ